MSPPGWRQRWRRLLRPPRTLRITPAGRTYLVLTLGVGLGALNTGNNLLYLLLGLQLSVIVISGVLSESCLRGLTVRRLGSDAVFAQEPGTFRWALIHDRGYAFGLTLAEAGDDLQAAGSLAVLPPATEVVVAGTVVAGRRGPVPLVGVRVTTEFPFGLFAKTRLFDLPGELLVYPRRRPVDRRAQAPTGGPVGLVPSARHRDGSGEPMGLRELRPEEDARRVHWKKSAAAGRLLHVERQREERRTFHLALPPLPLSPALDERCEQLAAQAHRLLGEGHEVSLSTPALKLRAGVGAAHETRLLRALALAGWESPP